MILYASPKVQGTDLEGNTQPVSVVGAQSNELRIADIEQRDLLESLIKELKIMNIHLSSMTDLEIDREEIE